MIDSDRPYAVLARLDCDTIDRWWIRTCDGLYLEWERHGENPYRMEVPAYRLRPVRKDFSVYVGDPRAIAEVWTEVGKLQYAN
jgi:hypothetical protein